MDTARPFSRYFRFDRFNPRKRIELNTNDAIKNEIFASLEFISEVEEAGKDLISSLGKSTNIDKSYLFFKAFIRQAKTFFESAETLHYRASSLNYYYSFLNLAKAYIALHDPDYVEKQISHGISHPFEDSNFGDQFLVLNTSNKNVFEKFYSLVTHTPLSKKVHVPVLNLIGYCTDVAHEYEQLNHGDHKNSFGKLIIACNKKTKKAHILLAMGRYHAFGELNRSLKQFLTYFKPVEVKNLPLEHSLKISDPEKIHYRFFESFRDYPYHNEQPDNALIQTDIMNALQGLYISNPYKEDIDFFMPSPLQENPFIPFNEVLAIYSTMFYLGSLVRYYPWYLEKILSGKDAWIIERFTKCSSITFLRHMINFIYNTDFIFIVR